MENLQDLGYIGLFIATFLAATVVPFSSDVGVFRLSDTWLQYVSFVGSGNRWQLVGKPHNLLVGYAGNMQHIEKWFKVNLKKLEKLRPKVEKYGSLLALLVWVPFIGDVFAIALGFYKVEFKRTAVFILIGKFLRFVLLCVLFYFFKGVVNV